MLRSKYTLSPVRLFVTISLFYYTRAAIFCQKTTFFKKMVLFVARLLQYNIYNKNKHNAMGVFCHGIIDGILLQKRKRRVLYEIF